MSEPTKKSQEIERFLTPSHSPEDERSDLDETQPIEFTETDKGREALYRWAKLNYDSEGRYDY